EIAFGMGKLSEELFFNLGKLNKLRNQVAHDLAFDLTKLELDYQGCAEHFELSTFKPSFDPNSGGNHLLNVLGLISTVTFVKLHNYCIHELGFGGPNDQTAFWEKTSTDGNLED